MRRSPCDGGKIVAVGKSAEIAKNYAGKKTVDGRNTVATPGFVDCHLHSSFQLSRGLADEANAQSFLFDRMYPYEAALDADDVRVSATLAATELLKHGVTCFIDPGNYHPESSVEGVMSTGIRMIVSRSSFDLTKSVLGLLPERMIENTATALERAEAVLEKYAKSGNPRLGASASFRGLNNASDELIVGLDKLAKKYGTLLQTHACFSYSTHDSSIARGGLAEIERLEKLGVLDERMLVVHSGWLEPQEVAMLAKRKPSLVCAPSSSLHNGYGNFVVGKLPELMALGVNVAIGSDHASSGIVDMTQEVRLACCCYKEMRLNPRVMPPETGVEMATINGAKAALMADRIGSIEVGKEADVVLFDTRRPEWQPLINPVANLVYSATGDSVRDVFVAGEQVVADGSADQDRREQALRGHSRGGDALLQAPQGRPDGAVEMAGDVMDAPDETEAEAPAVIDGLEFPFADYPAPGTATEVADGIFWISTPVPFVGLKQVNLWLLRDGDGWTMIDCSYGSTRAARADRSGLGQGARRPADHAADRHAFPSGPRRRLRLDRREVGPAPAHVAGRMADRQPRGAQPQHRPSCSRAAPSIGATGSTRRACSASSRASCSTATA